MNKEKSANCANCGKDVPRYKQYYRDGKIYCNKNCYKDLKKKEAESK